MGRMHSVRPFGKNFFIGAGLVVVYITCFSQCESVLVLQVPCSDNTKGGRIVKEAIRFLTFKCIFGKRLMACLGAVFAIALFAGQAQAFQFKTTNPDLKVSFDNTFTYSAMYRLGDQDPTLISGPRDPKIANKDDGDRNFDKGITMNRIDLYSEFDLNYKKFGVRFSGAAYYDTVYNKINDNDSPYTVNNDITKVPYNEFSDTTVKLHGKNAELMDAFTFGSLYLGDAQLTYKAGQYGLWWGTSFFFGDNGIAGGMGPVNIAKAATLPNMMMKDLLLPVPQASANLQVTNALSFGAYYQFKWKPNRFFGVGSYFSPVDLFDNDGGGDRIITGPGMQFTRDKSKDIEADNAGQFGLQMQYQAPFGVDFGTYYLRYHDKMPQVYTSFSDFPPQFGPPPFDKMWLVYPENIQVYGISANASIDIWTMAAEVSYRTNMPFVSNDDMQTLMPGQTADNDENPMYAVGKSLHVNLTFFNPGLPSTFFSDTADLIFEIGYNKRMSIDKREDLLKPGTKEYGLKTKIIYEPKWYQFLPAFDLTMPMSIEYAPEGRSSVQSTGIHKGGLWNIGIGGTYDNIWTTYITYVNYYGDADYQAHADRDYIGFTIRRAF